MVLHSLGNGVVAVCFFFAWLLVCALIWDEGEEDHADKQSKRNNDRFHG